MTWPQKRHPRNRDRDVSLPILDWISGEYSAPHTDGRKLETIAAAIAKQFRPKGRKVAKGRSDA
jgi:hypothetical protein